MVDFKDYTYKMDRTLEVLQEDFGAVRAGRANARVLDRISVEYYGVDTPIGQVGTIASPDARTLVIQPWDGSLLKKIEKAIQTSDLGINPQNDGRVIRLVFPQLTEERRRELTKQVKKYGEDAKVAVRNIRRDAMDYVKALKKKSEITEDDQKKAEKDLQDLTDKYIKKVDEACAVKEKELMELLAPRIEPASQKGTVTVPFCADWARIGKNYNEIIPKEGRPGAAAADPDPHRHRHGRQRPLGKAAWPAASCRT